MSENSTNERFVLDDLINQINAFKILLADSPAKQNTALREGLSKIESTLAKVTQAFKNLEKENDLLNSLLNSSPSLIFAKDSEGRFTYCNNAFLKSINKSSSDLLGKSVFDLFPKHIATALNQFDLEATEKKVPVQREELLPTLDAQEWFLTSLYPASQQGNSSGLYGIITNVNADRLRNEEVAAKNRKMEQILKVIPLVIFSFAPKSPYKINFINDFSLHYGWEPESFLNNEGHWESCIHPDDLNDVLNRLSKLYITGQGSLEYRFRTRSGAYYWVRDEYIVNYDNARRPSEVIGFRTEITEVVVTRNRFESLYHAIDMKAIVAVTDGFGKITYVNDNFCEISGYSREELIGRSHKLVNSGLHSSEFFAEMWKTVKAGKMWSGEICNRKKDGSLYWVSSTISPYKNNKIEGENFIAIRFDITSEKYSQQKLVESAKFASLGEMAAGIAHEVNNPLAIIQGRSAQLRRRIQENNIDLGEFDKQLDAIESTVGRITKTIAGLRAFSRNSDADPLVATKLSTLLEDVLSLCTERFKSQGVTLRVHNDFEASLNCRPSQVSQVLLNLLNNAYDAIENATKKWIEINVKAEGGAIQICVVDSGPGIPANVVKQLMMPFFTTKGIGKGTGLGLSISKGIAEMHGGTLCYDSSCKNTKFILELPAQLIEPLEKVS